MTSSDRQNMVLTCCDAENFVKGDMVEINGGLYEVVNVTRSTLTLRHRRYYRQILALLIFLFFAAFATTAIITAHNW